MRLEEELYNCLKNVQGGISALRAPQNASHPYSVYLIIADIKTNALPGQCYYPQIRFQIDVYADDLFECMSIRDDIEAKLLAYSDFKCIIYQSFSNVADAGKTFQSTIDFKLTK